MQPGWELKIQPVKYGAWPWRVVAVHDGMVQWVVDSPRVFFDACDPRTSSGKGTEEEPALVATEGGKLRSMLDGILLEFHSDEFHWNNLQNGKRNFKKY